MGGHFPVGIAGRFHRNAQAFTLAMLRAMREKKIKPGEFVIFIDTRQRATSHASQNNDEQMQVAVHHCESLGRAVGGPVVVAFHPAKHGSPNDISGSAIIGNSSTGIWKLTDKNGIKTLTVDRIKGGKEGIHKQFEFDVINIGPNEQFAGLMDSSVVARQVELLLDDEADSAVVPMDDMRFGSVLYRILESKGDVIGKWRREFTQTQMATALVDYAGRNDNFENIGSVKTAKRRLVDYLGDADYHPTLDSKRVLVDRKRDGSITYSINLSM